MKKLMKIQIFIFLFASPLFSFAQVSAPRYLQNGADSFQAFIRDSSMIDTLPICEAGLFALRFKISQNGVISQESFSQGLPIEIKNTLRKILLKNSGKWLSIADSSFAQHDTSSYLLYNIYVSITKDCNQKVLDEWFRKNYKGILDKKSHISDSLRSKVYKIAEKKFKTNSLEFSFYNRLVQSSKQIYIFDDQKAVFGLSYILLGTIFLE